MRNDLKFYLLAELSGWSCAPYIENISYELISSPEYKILEQNVELAKQHLSSDANEVVESFESLDMDPRTVEEVFILQDKIYYLALNSYPEYFINPFAVHPNFQSKVTSIGQLMFSVNGKQRMLNDIIMDDTVSSKEKKEAVDDQLQYYLKDIENTANESLNKLRNDKGFSRRDVPSMVWRVITYIILALSNAFFVVLYARAPDVMMEFLYTPDFTKVMTYVMWGYPIVLFLYDLFFSIFHSYRARVSEPYTYAKRFVVKNSEKVFDDLDASYEKLKNYIYGAINSKIALKNDIHDFSRLSKGFIDFDAVIHVEKVKNRRAYGILSALNGVFAAVCGLMFVFSSVILTIGVVFNAAV